LLLFVCWLALVWLAGCTPTGLILTSLAGGEVDLRDVGSGNIGATNVGRNYGWRLGSITMALDIAKGALPTAATLLLFPSTGLFGAGAAAFAAWLGHCASVYLGFRGGKGVATAAGAMLIVAPKATGLAALAWLTIMPVTRIGSVASLGSTAVLLAALAYFEPAVLPMASVLAVGILVRHRTNVSRLLRGQEFKAIGETRWDLPRNPALDALHQDVAGRPVPFEE